MKKTKNIRNVKSWLSWKNALRASILIMITIALLIERTIWTPDTLFIILLAVFTIFGQARPFLLRFAPLILLLLAYESFRSLVPHLNTSIHYWEMIHFDMWLGRGLLPTKWLQSFMWNGHLQWYDFYFYFLYTIHFLMPIALGVLIWKKFGDGLYWQFMLALVLLSYGAFVTYLLFPAAPPWMSSELGYFDPIHRISSDVWWAMGIKDFSSFYEKLSPNPVAAVPSLHSAYPALFALFINRMYTFKKSWWVWFYPASVWLGVVYLGEHYVIDVILGVLYAVLAFVAADKFVVWQRKRNWPLRTRVNKIIRRYITIRFKSLKKV
jgi:hypothetical protein